MKFAFVFPGQGSQSVGMLDAFGTDPAVVDVVQRASEALGEDLAGLIARGPAEELGLTVNTQPCMLTAALAVYAAWRAAGGAEPAMMAGHSLGEYSALTAASAFTLEQAVPLVRARARAMQEATPVGSGAMAAILGLDDDAVRAVCAEAAQGEVVEPVNFNAPAQVVIAGHKAAVDRACAMAKQRGAKRAVPLAVSAPFHSSLLQPASAVLRGLLANLAFAAPRVPVVNNVDVAIESDPVRIRDALARQAARPVRWVEVVRRFADEGVTHVVECGPGKVLAGLTRRIDSRLEGLAIHDPASIQEALKTLGDAHG
jgi:[acyl-carrier-protein] S-malonyltransferase